MQSVNTWRCRDRLLAFRARPLLMGILNVTPDSFSDGGCYATFERAVAHARTLISEGADIIDVGGESTRPGAAAVSVQAELDRVVPVIDAIRQASDVPLSVDTSKAAVAEAALEAGADIVNDVTAGDGDAAMLPLAARYGCGLVLMHMQGTPSKMQANPHYEDVVGEVETFLSDRALAAMAAGVPRACLMVDPGIGFGKTVAHNLALLAATRRLANGAFPVLVGLSRKRFLAAMTGRPVGQRLSGSLAALAYCAANRAAVMRVHDVAASRDAVEVVSAIRAAEGGEGDASCQAC